MLMIKMSRIGKKKKPVYRLTIAEKSRDPFGKALEILGTYNPFTKNLSVKKDRIVYWLSVGAGMTPTVNNLLIENKIIEGEKMTASKKGKKQTKTAGKKKEASPAKTKDEAVVKEETK